MHRFTTRHVAALIGSLGIAVAATAATPALAATTQASTPTTASITRVRPDGGLTSTAVIRLTPPDAVADATAFAPALSPPPTATATAGSSETYTLMPGESFWSVATDRLREVTGEAHVDDAEVVRYWQTLLEANPLPNPSLLFVGQVIELPPVSA